MKKIICIVLSLLFLCSCSLTGQYGNMIDESKLDFDAQLSYPKENEKIAVVTTTQGVIKMKLFENHAPKACENFITLAREGYYNDSFVFFIEPDVAFMAGTKDREGKNATTIFEENKPFDNEYTDALWHFSGAVSSMSIEKNKSDSRFFITANATVPDETLETMTRVGYPQKLVDKYKEQGGIPGLDKNYTIFAQVYEGMDVVSKIMSSTTDQDGVPTPDVKIITVEISQFCEE